MGNYELLIAAIEQVIKTNGNNEITGAILQTTLKSIVNSVGANATFAGVATPATNPGTPDQNVLWLAFEGGNYSNFGIELGYNLITFISNSEGSWKVEASIPLYDVEQTTVNSALLSTTNEILRFNLIDKEAPDYLPQKSLTASGAIVSDANKDLTGYIAFPKRYNTLCGIIERGLAIGKGFRYILYDVNKQMLSTGEPSAFNTINWIEGTAYIRLSIPRDTNVYLYPHSEGVNNQRRIGYGAAEINWGVIAKENLQKISALYTNFFDITNLLDLEDENFIQGHHIYGNSGTLSANAGCSVSGFIPFTKEMGSLAAVNRSGFITGGAYVQAYDKFGNVIISGTLGDATTRPMIWQEGVVMARFSVHGGNKEAILSNKIMIIAGYDGTGPVPEYQEPGAWKLRKSIIPQQEEVASKQLNGLLGMPSAVEKSLSLSTGNSLSIMDFPQNIKKGLSLSMYAELSSAGVFYFGFGYKSYRGKYFKIDGTNVSLLAYDGSESAVDTQEHGLTLKSFVKCIMSVGDDKQLYLLIQTEQGQYSHIFLPGNDEYNGYPFVRADSIALANIKITASCEDFRKPIWMFGDSYMGRWLEDMRNIGFFNILLDGLAGQSSSGAYQELTKALNYGNPKYVVWMLGMNDSEENYKTYFQLVKSLCEDKDITMVATTIPTTPTRDKESITSFVKSSGVRYIDWYEAVGANATGTWYDGYLSSDNVHPTAVGADSLATQILVDFPEIMRFGRNGHE